MITNMEGTTQEKIDQHKKALELIAEENKDADFWNFYEWWDYKAIRNIRRIKSNPLI